MKLHDSSEAEMTKSVLSLNAIGLLMSGFVGLLMSGLVGLVLAADLSKPETESTRPAENRFCRSECELCRMDGRLPQLHEGRLLKHRHRISAQ